MTPTHQPAPTCTDQGIEHLIDLLLTRAIFHPSDRRGRQLTEVITVLRYYGTTPVITDDGEHCPALVDPASIHHSYPGHTRVRRLRGVTFEEEQAYWERLKAEMGARRATAPREVLDRYFPPELRKVVAGMLLDGPYVFADRTAAALKAYADTPITPTRTRPMGGFPMRSNIRQKIKQIQRLVAPMFDANRLRVPADHPSTPHLKRWRSEMAAPPRIVVPTKPQEKKTVALGPPPLERARYVLAELDLAIQGALGVTSEDEVIPAIQALSDRKAIHGGLHRLLRNRGLFLLCAAVGQRVDAALRTNRRDLDVTVAHHLETTTGVRHTPLKTKSGEIPRVKPLPEGLWLRLEAIRVFTNRASDALGLPRLSEGDPLFIGTLQRRARHLDVSFYRWLAGPNGKLLVVPAPMLEDEPAHSDDEDHFVPGQGYSPHTLRKLARTLVSSKEAESWADEHNLPVSLLETMGEILLDHEHKDLPAIYKGYTTDGAIEMLAGRAIQLTWELLAEDRGRRRLPDVEAYRHALIQHDTAIRETARLGEEFDRQLADAERHGRDVSNAAVHRLRRATEAATRAALAAKEVIDEVEQQKRVVFISDLEMDVEPVDLQAVKAEVLGRSAVRTTKPRVRNWLTGDELAAALRIGTATVRARIAKTYDPELGVSRSCAYWDCGAIHAFSSRRRAILGDRLAEQILADETVAGLVADVLATDPPAGWTTFPLFV